MLYRFKASIVACARWESYFIVEWLNYYRAIGFDHVFLYCNDDDPSELYEKVLPFTQGKEPFLTFRFYPQQGEQMKMYAHFLEHDRNSSEWISFIDIDEYIRLPTGVNIVKFIDRFPNNTDCILFNWIFFGPDGHKDHAGTSILREYKRRQSSIHPFTKYIARTHIFTGAKISSPNWHYPVEKEDQNLHAINVLGEDMSSYYEGFPDHSATFVNEPDRKNRLLSTAIIHHYAFRSEAAFTERVKRGLGGAFSGQTMWGTIASDANFDGFVAGLNEVEDASLADFWPRLLQAAKATNVLAQGAPADKLISRGKSATQSSISQWSTHSTETEEAGLGISGIIDGRHAFHTDIEDSPWWQIDLGSAFGVSEVRIFNRMDQSWVVSRASRLAIEFGLEEDCLIEMYRREKDEPFGGVDGNPLIFKPIIPIPSRFVRIRLLTRNYLHLEQVEIYGDPMRAPENTTTSSRGI